jgi:hypothetical protein
MKSRQGKAIALAVLIFSVAAASTAANPLLGLWEVMALDAEEMLEMRPRSANETEKVRYRIDQERQTIALPLMPFPLRCELPDDLTLMFYIDVDDPEALGW